MEDPTNTQQGGNKYLTKYTLNPFLTNKNSAAFFSTVPYVYTSRW